MTQYNEAIYHKLVKVLKFSTTKMQCTYRQARGLYLGYNVGKGKGKKVDKCFWECGAKSDKNHGAS